MTTMNLGCGPDSWGDVRVDIDFMTQTGIKSKLNLRADAQQLPFRDNVFSTCRCWHVVEHAADPLKVFREVRRTSQFSSLRFPVDEGYYKQILLGLIGLDWNMFINGYRTLRTRAHRWIIRSSSARRTDRFIEFPRWLVILRHGRKGRLFARYFRPLRFYYEFEISI